VTKPSILLALLALASASAAAQRVGVSPAACTAAQANADELAALDPGVRALAVLAFETPSGDQARHDLAASLGARVSDRLRAVRPREVIVRTTRGSDAAGAVHGRTGVEARYLLAATLEPDRPGVSFHVRLLDGRTGREVWRGRFARTRERIHELEGAIAGAVATRTLRDLTSEQQRDIAAPPTRSATAYGHLLAGLQASAPGGRSGLRRAVGAFDAAWRADPGFVDAWVNLAMAYSRLLESSALAERDAAAMLAAAFAATDRALALDAGRSDAWVARAILLERRHPRTLAGVRDAYERALAVDPNDWEAHRRLARLLAHLGEHERAAAHFRSALFLEPEYGATLVDFAELRLTQRRYGEACALLNAALDADPAFVDAYILRVLTRIPLREYRAAWADAETAMRLGSPVRGEAVSVLVDLAAEDTAGARARARQLARRPLVESNGALSVREGQLLALAFLAVGERALAVGSLERVRPRGAELWYAMQHPGLEALRTTRSFEKLLVATSPFEDQP
jgi:tetratricopeptide (TPR) repeat protein